MTRRRVALRCALAAAALALIALAPLGARAACRGDAGGIGGTGAQPSTPAPKPGKGGKDRGGVGGTGIGEQASGGIGGTGIVGTVTGFGSVCVNGLEVAYDDASRAEADGAPIRPGALAVGQLVVIDARPRDGGLWAARIEVRHAAVGPVDRADPARGELQVLGQRVRVDASTRLVGNGGAPAELGAFAPGTFVAVSGLRRPDGAVLATRLAAAPASDRVSVSGPLVANGRGGASIGGLEIFTSGDDATMVPAGRATFAAGRLDAQGALRADRIEPLARFAPAPARLSIEAFVQAPQRGGFRTDVVDVVTAPLGERAALATPDARVVVSGPVARDGRLVAERIELVKPDPAADGAAAAAAEARSARPEGAEPIGIPAGVIEPHEAVQRPETPERVETPEVERPETPEVERPEVPELERPETPEVERPQVPEVERPEVPEVERPQTPDRPEIPQVEKPEVPEVERPETPEHVEQPVRPEVPEIEHQGSD